MHRGGDKMGLGTSEMAHLIPPAIRSYTAEKAKSAPMHYLNPPQEFFHSCLLFCRLFFCCLLQLSGDFRSNVLLLEVKEIYGLLE